ncbi:MAG: polymer-forming cytoskeletal protein [Ruminococcus sp.]|nr:polymer-forming cytoskeletal protein [Ruminococcus sp.]MCM1382504.1 polymer-forming cytoskeletal protein [Muribaculaceae bacterium]MCM1480125.1 polymer-forming cytoskeletal protein [Muribaculaceae bacterium]
MSLKDNFNQAVKEILRKDGLVGDDLSKESKKKSELDRYIDAPQPEPVQDGDFGAKSDFPEADIAPESAAAPPPSSPYVGGQDVSQFGARPPRQDYGGQQGYPNGQGGFNQQQGYGGAPNQGYPNQGYPQNQNQGYGQQGYGQQQGYPQNQGFGQNMNMGQQGQGFNQQGFVGNAPMGGNGSPSGFGGNGGYGNPPAPPAYGGGEDSPYYETEETTIISRNTIINGNIRSFANVNIDGSVKGDVRITKNISVAGKVVGDVECNDSIMTGASMQGNLASKGRVQMDRDTIILGDIAAQYLDLNGKIKGNVDIGGKAEFKTDAIVMGNITASTITVLDGATIQGYVNTTFLQESSSNIFPEAIAVTE